jgi:replication-associated recombination protein RarA
LYPARYVYIPFFLFHAEKKELKEKQLQFAILFPKNKKMTSIPWVEKYRATDFEQIVLDPLNKIILKNVIETSHFPNLLLYGPPGTGKTTTIINLINAYQEKMNQKYNS